MSLIVPDVGKKRFLDWITGARALPGNWYLGLTKITITPVDATVWADLTEADFDGYTRKALAVGTWIAAAITTPRAVSTYTSTPQLWAPASGSQTVYATFMLDTTDNTLLSVEPLAAAMTLSPTLGLSFLPRITTRSEY